MEKVLTENVELEHGLALANHILSAAYDHPAVVVGREVRQGEAALRCCGLNLDTKAFLCRLNPCHRDTLHM